MFDKVQITLWDWFVSFLSGFLLIVVVLANIGFSNQELVANLFTQLKDSPFSGFLSLFCFCLLAGLLLEPLANFIEKKLSKVCLKCCCLEINYFQGNSEEEKRIKDKYEKIIKDKLSPPCEDTDIFHWAKNFLIQENINTSYMAFLSKFGFYRSVGSIFYLNVILIPALHFRQINSVKTLLIIIACSCASLLLGMLYSLRSKTFYNHLSLTVYQGFLIARTK